MTSNDDGLARPPLSTVGEVPATRTESHIPSDDDLQPIRALNDLLFCERRCAMHRIEQVWVDNVFTIEGIHAHSRADDEGQATPRGVRTARGVLLRSLRLGLAGKADIVEFHPNTARPFSGHERAHEGDRHVSPADLPCADPPATRAPAVDRGKNEPVPGPLLKKGTGTSRPGDFVGDFGVALGASPLFQQAAGPDGGEVPFPVEYKRGKRRRWDNNDVQLCAQALCLEEMLGVAVPAGALFHVRSKRRQPIVFTPELRARTEAAARRLHDLVRSGITPPAVVKPRCRGCSLYELCMPELFSQTGRVSNYERTLWSVSSD